MPLDQHNPPPVGRVCIHLLGEKPIRWGQYYSFTGHGRQYDLICDDCQQNLETLPSLLREVSRDQFVKIERYAERIIGKPSVFERPSSLHFLYEEVQLTGLLASDILDIQPIRGAELSLWLAIFKTGTIAKINLTERLVTPLFTVTPADFTLDEYARLGLSEEARFVALVNDKGSDGIVIDLETSRITMPLHRGNYYAEQTPFPAAFFKSSEKIYLAHASDWNRLDLSNPETGELLSSREHPPWKKGDPHPEHYLDYFHGRLTISPNAEWIADDGWSWHPVGIIRVWNLKQWLQHNPWESEDGESLCTPTGRIGFWDAPLCWIADSTLAVWGFGYDERWMLPAVQLFDVVSGELLRWFAGPEKGLLEFDEYLFSAGEKGTDVWDIATGERLLHDPEFKPRCYHYSTHQFLTLLPDGGFRLSHLAGQD